MLQNTGNIFVLMKIWQEVRMHTFGEKSVVQTTLYTVEIWIEVIEPIVSV